MYYDADFVVCIYIGLSNLDCIQGFNVYILSVHLTKTKNVTGRKRSRHIL